MLLEQQHKLHCLLISCYAESMGMVTTCTLRLGSFWYPLQTKPVLSYFIHIYPSPYSIEERRKWARNDTKYPYRNVVFLCLRTPNFRFWRGGLWPPGPPDLGALPPWPPLGEDPQTPLILFLLKPFYFKSY